jgi:hypothetical protein
MKYVQLNILAAVYNLHFGHYSKDKKHVTQLILSKVWRSYIQSRIFELYIPRKNIKRLMKEALKEFKIGTSNQDDSNKTTFQCVDVLEQFKTIDGHTLKNVFKN